MNSAQWHLSCLVSGPRIDPLALDRAREQGTGPEGEPAPATIRAMDFWVALLLGDLTSEPQNARGYGMEDINSSFKEESQQAVETLFRSRVYVVRSFPSPATRLEVFHCRAAMPRPFSCCVEGPTTNGHLWAFSSSGAGILVLTIDHSTFRARNGRA